MINAKNLTSRSDLIGATASTLCFFHCLATPFVFVAHAGLAATDELHPWWWGILDITFLVISFFAVYWSTKNTPRKWIKLAFWILWGALALMVLNEKFHLASLAEEVIYLPTLGLIFLHFYNRQHSH